MTGSHPCSPGGLQPRVAPRSFLQARISTLGMVRYPGAELWELSRMTLGSFPYCPTLTGQTLKTAWPEGGPAGSGVVDPSGQSPRGALETQAMKPTSPLWSEIVQHVETGVRVRIKGCKPVCCKSPFSGKLVAFFPPNVLEGV